MNSQHSNSESKHGNMIRTITALRVRFLNTVLIASGALLFQGCVPVPTQPQVQGGWRIAGTLNGKSQVWFARAVRVTRPGSTVGTIAWSMTVEGVDSGPVFANNAERIRSLGVMDHQKRDGYKLHFVSVDRQNIELNVYRLKPIPDESQFLEAAKIAPPSPSGRAEH